MIGFECAGNGLEGLTTEELIEVEGGQSLGGWATGLPIAALFGTFGVIAYTVGYWS